MEKEKDRQQYWGSDPDAYRVGSALFFRIWVGIKARHIKKCTLFPQNFPMLLKKIMQCCRSGIRCLFDPGSGIRNRFFSGSRSRIPNPFFKNSRTNFWVNGIIILWLNNILYQFKNEIIYYFMIFVATKNSRTKNCPPLLVLLLDPRSGIRYGLKWGTGIRDKHPWPATLKLWHRRHWWER